MAELMGFEGQAYYGAAGATGSTLLEPSRDITISLGTTRGSTKSRGASGIPKNTERVTSLDWSCTINMLNDPADSAVEAMKVAANAGTPIALRMKDNSSGKGYDGDVVLDMELGEPLDGEQTLDFTCTPTKVNRAPQLYV